MLHCGGGGVAALPCVAATRSAFGSRSKTVRSWPAAIRLRMVGIPMAPRPIWAMRIVTDVRRGCADR
eukprot:scaffold8877_cov112-Isochrysis_galbana.AAC.2